MPLSDTVREAAERLVLRYPVARSAVLPILHLVQSEQGCVTDEGIALCAEMVGLTKAEVGAVATFYTMFKREPVGDWLLSVCTNPTCKFAGATEIYAEYEEALGGHRDPEAGITLEHAECLGICDAAPVVQVNYEMYGPLEREAYTDLLASCRDGDPPPSNWSGEVPKRFAEVQWELSGAADTWADELVRAAREQVLADVPPSYRTGETDLPVTHPGGDPRGHGGRVFAEGFEPDRSVVGQTRLDEDGGTPPAADADAPPAGDDVAEEGLGVAEERADDARSPDDAAPPAADQPATAGEGDVPAEQSGEQVDDGTGSAQAAGPDEEA